MIMKVEEGKFYRGLTTGNKYICLDADRKKFYSYAEGRVVNLMIPFLLAEWKEKLSKTVVTEGYIKYKHDESFAVSDLDKITGGLYTTDKIYENPPVDNPIRMYKIAKIKITAEIQEI